MTTYTYTVRVELHEAPETVYATLHTAMASAGFERFVTANDGVRYALPTGEYHLQSSSETLTSILNRVSKIAQAHQPELAPPRRPSILVTEGGSIWQLDRL